MALGLLLIRFDFFYRKILRKRSFFYTFVTWTSILVALAIVGLLKLVVSSNDPNAITKDFIYLQSFSSFFLRRDISNVTKDWSNYVQMKQERARIGFGEHGLKTYSDGKELAEVEERLLAENGHNAFVSDKIALDRSIPDFRSIECKRRLYKKDLPTVSVIIPFYDEHLSTLLRSIHSVVNRSPPELLKEIVLVNDASTKTSLYEELQKSLESQSWSHKLKIFSMKKRSGLIWSRLAGARYATGDVLLFLDCHIEAGHNFLPPLLDPIVFNYRVVVTPTLDIIDKNTYEIRPLGVGRTVFDWNFHAQRIPLPGNNSKESELFETPILYGAAFAISAKFFWELQPDSGLKIYGGDQLEMSFKINLCGGKLFESPCSRIAHIYRRFPYAKHQNGVDYKARNNKRVAEIWLDDYKKYFYARHPERYERIKDIGDLSAQLALKQKLECKPFSHFLEKVAPDMLERFPLEEFKNFASGTIRNMKLDKCIEITDRDEGGAVNIAKCSHNKTNPVQHQHFTLRHFRDIQIHGKSDCLEGTAHGLVYSRCHYEQGNQYFRYDLKSLHLNWGRKINNLCVDANPDAYNVFINFCNDSSETQKWVWGFSRVSYLKSWVKNGAPIIDENEVQTLLNITVIVEGSTRTTRKHAEEGNCRAN